MGLCPNHTMFGQRKTFLQKTAFSLVKSRLALGSPGWLFVGYHHPAENGLMPPSDHIHWWNPFTDQKGGLIGPASLLQCWVLTLGLIKVIFILLNCSFIVFSAQRVGFFSIGSGGVLNKIPGSGSGSGRVRVSKNTIGYFRVSFFLSGISGYFGYFRVCRVFLGISGFTHIY